MLRQNKEHMWYTWVADQHEGGNQVFNIMRPFHTILTNVHWIAPSNEETLAEILHHLGSGEFGKVVEALGAYFPHVQKLAC